MTYKEKLIWAEPPMLLAGRHIKRYYVVVRHMLVPDVADLDGYLADTMADGMTEGRAAR